MSREHCFEEDHLAEAAEIDELGHVSNIAYVRWIQEVAKAHSRALGWDHAAYVAAGGVFVVRRHEIDYLAPSYAGQTVHLTTWIESWSAATCVRRTRIVRRTDGGEIEIVRADTTWAFVSTEKGRPRRIPAEILKAFE